MQNDGNEFLLRMSEQERAGLVAVLRTLRNKGRKGEWWRGQIAPLQGLMDRLGVP